MVPARSVNGESVLLPNAYLLAENGHLRESGSTGVRTALGESGSTGVLTAFRIRDATAYVIYSCESCELRFRVSCEMGNTQVFSQL